MVQPRQPRPANSTSTLRRRAFRWAPWDRPARPLSTELQSAMDRAIVGLVTAAEALEDLAPLSGHEVAWMAVAAELRHEATALAWRGEEWAA